MELIVKKEYNRLVALIWQYDQKIAEFPKGSPLEQAAQRASLLLPGLP